MNPSPYLNFWWTGELAVSEAALISWARTQRLLPLLGWRAAQEGWSLSPTLQQAVKEARYRLTAREVLLKQQLKQLSEIVVRQEIPVVVVKGPVIAEFYPETILRPYSDLDLLVPEQDVTELITALQQEEYHAELGGGRSTHLPPLYPSTAGFRVEIHTALDAHGADSLFTFERWAESSAPWRAFPSMRIPDPLEHLLYLTYHLIERHQFAGGGLALADFKFLTAGWGIYEWQTLQERAMSLGMLRSVGLALRLVAWFWPATDLTEALTYFPFPPDKVLAVSQRMLLGYQSKLLPSVWRDLEGTGYKDWIRYLKKILFGEPQQAQRMSFMEKLHFGLHRPVHLVRTYTPAAWSLLRGDPESRAAWQARRELMVWLRAEEGL
ncbi:MAG: nucleotidyltransferase family protein [Anaerolineae bacterium]|nr:nucleotidyltransferase family protein [Anaerolineae bacterium]